MANETRLLDPLKIKQPLTHPSGHLSRNHVIAGFPIDSLHVRSRNSLHNAEKSQQVNSAVGFAALVLIRALQFAKPSFNTFIVQRQFTFLTYWLPRLGLQPCPPAISSDLSLDHNITSTKYPLTPRLCLFTTLKSRTQPATMNASCQCGAIKFKTPLPKPLALYICHCDECRLQSGSAYGCSAIFPAFKLPGKDLLSCYS